LPDFGIDRAEATRQLDHTFVLLRSRQAANGGIGYWDAAGAAAGFDWLSVYVAHFASEAKAARFDPPGALTSGLARRLQEMAKLPVTTRAEAAIQAHAIYLLTSSGQVTTNYVLNLRDTLETRFKREWESDLTAAYLAGTYSLLQQKPEAEKLMQAHREATAKQAPPRVWTTYYESPLAYQAQSLALVCKHFPAIANDVGYDQLRPVIDPLERSQFNTVSSAWAVLALKAYSASQAAASIQLGLEELPRAGGPPRLLVPASSGMVTGTFSENAKAVVFHLDRPPNAPDLGAFYQTIESGFDRTPPAQPIGDGLEAAQELVGSNGAAVNRLRVGDGASFRVRVRNLADRPLTHLAVLNLLPGGFEIEHGSLKPGRNAVAGADFVEVREDRNIFFCNLAAREVREFTFRVKPTCAGDFVIPPGFIESMYLRDLKGRGVSTRIEVQNRE
jgi:alpha-2-macroglobulin